MNILSFFSFAVFAAELIISPIPPDEDIVIRKPRTTFGMLTESSWPSGAVLGEEVTATPSTQTPTLPQENKAESNIQQDTPAPTPKPIKNSSASPNVYSTHTTKRSHYTVAVLGDSMVDTLGPGIPHLQEKLDTVFPQTDFTVLNYGVGATNIEYGLDRVTKDYTYLDKHVPSLVSQHPDIVVIESFGYNPFPFDAGALDKHWLTMGTIVDTIRAQAPGVKIIIGATVAPNSDSFGDGAPGIAFDPQSKKNQTANIKKYLQSAINFATSQKVPLADAYTPSLLSDGNGNPIFINQGDHIHPSDAGKAMFAEKIIAALVDNRLLE